MILYKYYPCNEYTFQSLSERSFWCGKHDSMNDPFEGLAMKKRIFSSQDVMDFADFFKHYDPQGYDRFRHNYSDSISFSELIHETRLQSLKLLGFSSFTEDPLSILMWSHYANSHKGIVIAYNMSEFINSGLMQPVSYVEELSTPNWKNYLGFLNESEPIVGDILLDVSVKSIHWRDEKEWRLWRKGSGYRAFAPDMLKQVFFGLRCANDTKNTIRRILSEDFDHVQFLEARYTESPLGLAFD